MLTDFDKRCLDRLTAQATTGDDSPVMMTLPLKVVEKLMEDRRDSAALVCKLLQVKNDLETDLAVYRELERLRRRVGSNDEGAALADDAPEECHRRSTRPPRLGS